MATIVPFNRFSVYMAQRRNVATLNREGVATPTSATVLPFTRPHVAPLLAHEAIGAPDQKVNPPTRQHPVAEEYAGALPAQGGRCVGTLEEVLVRFESLSAGGVACGLTRLKRGVWELTPRRSQA